MGMDENELIRRAMSVIGSRTSEVKAATARKNGKLGGRPRGTLKPLSEIACTCGATEDAAHRATCPRGRTYRRRQKTEATRSA
jgi:hypothetical protein